MKIMKRILLVSITMIMMFMFIFGNSVFAKSNPMMSYVKKNKYTTDSENFHTENDCIWPEEGTNVYENVLTGDAKNKHVYVAVNWGVDFSIRYYWLEGLNNLVNYLKNKSYEDVANENDYSVISKTIDAMNAAKKELRSFFNSDWKDISDNEASKVAGTWTEVVSRSYS